MVLDFKALNHVCRSPCRPADREQFTLPDTDEGEPVNHPANLVATYAALAELRRIPLASLCTQVAHNFDRLFNAGDANPRSDKNRGRR